MLEIHVPYCPNNLGKYYNEVMKRASDWVLFIDHDVYLCCRKWFDICDNAIKKIGYQAGWISAMTNRIGCATQRIDNLQDTEDLNYHCQYAKRRFDECGYDLKEIEKAGPFSGFFILTHKKAWQAVGGFTQKEGLQKTIDNDYSNGLVKCGFKRYVLPGLYVYHRYTKKVKW